MCVLNNTCFSERVIEQLHSQELIKMNFLGSINTPKFTYFRFIIARHEVKSKSAKYGLVCVCDVHLIMIFS